MATPLILTSPSTVQPVEYRIAPEKLIQGNPLQRLWIDFQDTSTQFMVGLWWSEPGEWRVNYTEMEYCTLLQGQCELIGNDGSMTVIQAGQEFVVPAGFVGRWRVVDTCLKRFALYEPKATPEAA